MMSSNPRDHNLQRCRRAKHGRLETCFYPVKAAWMECGLEWLENTFHTMDQRLTFIVNPVIPGALVFSSIHTCSGSLVHAISKVCRILPSTTMLLRLWTHFHKTSVSYKILKYGWIALEPFPSVFLFANLDFCSRRDGALANPSRCSFKPI